MRLSELLRGIVDDPIPAQVAQAMISGVFDDSRRVAPRGLFVALRGSGADGRAFVDDAVRRGAAVVVGEELGSAGGVTMVRVADARLTLARLAARWYGLDGAAGGGLRLAGITGTNGKSTTTHMTCAILRAAGVRCGMLGTVQYDLCSRSVRADMTTPGPLQLSAYLRECVDAGATAAVMEVSSHALDQRRTDGLRFAAAAFTNLTQDHLDYHQTMERYRDAKARLFAGLDDAAVAVVNRDDPAHQDVIRGCPARIVGYSLQGETEITARISRDTIRGTLYRMRIDGADLVLENALIGRHNVYNALAAAGLARALGADARAIEAGLNSVRNIPGRLQRVPCMQGVDVLVDYAHTDDALRNVLSVLRPLTQRRLIVVFGCGGDRDKLKRPRMAKAVAEFADAIVVTSDNPRTEDPQAIIIDILAGFEADARRKVLVEADRKRAIHAALGGASGGDVVLIAGKGHEDYQIVGGQRLHFDDVEVAIAAGAELERSQTETHAR
jgi:UDP-N-acetylmuramoyl-L-alanyl-D-glutamate--2,6-diaminopimelate ligase